MKKLISRLQIFCALCVLCGSIARAQQTDIQFLSGQDKDDAVPWRFLCTSGAHSGVWTNLPVPSHWDMHGFGTLTYKKDQTNAWNERGLYEHEFSVAESWRGKRIFLVFEGVMTDTDAKLNGQSVGPVHQGSFYRFKYEVTSLMKFGATNKLEVTVSRHSANDSGTERNDSRTTGFSPGFSARFILRRCRRNSSSAWRLTRRRTGNLKQRYLSTSPI